VGGGRVIAHEVGVIGSGGLDRYCQGIYYRGGGDTPVEPSLGVGHRCAIIVSDFELYRDYLALEQAYAETQNNWILYQYRRLKA
jgi:hypothetical protein